jgi:isochorismate synthase
MEVAEGRKFTKEAEAIHSILATQLEAGGAFTLWRMPHSSESTLFICNNGVTEIDEVSLEESATGFVFAPFLPDQKKIFLKAERIYKFRGTEIHEDSTSTQHLINLLPKSILESKFKLHVKKTNSSNHASDFKELVAKGIREIESSQLEKIVPSRYKEVVLTEPLNTVETFLKLCAKHPAAFVSVFSSSHTGTWCGATPELLVSVDRESKFRTHALAGTLPYTLDMNLKSVAWTQKEIEEQAFVCRYIINCFKKIRVREYQEQGPKTVVAGNVMHLKTDYLVDMKEINFPQLGSVMLKLLHPTSAVCGMPLEPALQFLSANEGYAREFYSGYLGPINHQQESHLFVNLRCMQLIESAVRLYAGAGVTADSIPEKEYEETEIKMKNMLGVLANDLK